MKKERKKKDFLPGEKQHPNKLFDMEEMKVRPEDPVFRLVLWVAFCGGVGGWERRRTDTFCVLGRVFLTAAGRGRGRGNLSFRLCTLGATEVSWGGGEKAPGSQPGQGCLLAKGGRLSYTHLLGSKPIGCNWNLFPGPRTAEWLPPPPNARQVDSDVSSIEFNGSYSQVRLGGAMQLCKTRAWH